MAENDYKKPLYIEIKEDLLKEILNGRYPAGSFLMTESELCKKYGVSRITVRRALSSLAEDGWIERKSGSGTIIRNPAGEKSSVSSTGIGLVVTNLTSRFLGEIVRGIESEIRIHNKTLSIALSNGDPESELECIDHLLQSGIRDLIILSCEESMLKHRVDLFERMNVSLVLIDRNQKISYPYDFIGSDNSGGSYAAVRHLGNMGFSKLGFIQYRTSLSSVIQRYQGFCQAMKDFNLTGLTQNPMFLDNLKNETAALEKEVPFGLVAVNDEIALEVMKTLKSRGLKIGSDVGIIGFDNSPTGEYVTPGLTTVLQNPLLIGQNAVEALMDRKEEKTNFLKRIFIPTQLLLRNSCGE